MPRRKGSASTASAIRQVQRQAGSVLGKLRKDIRAMETELARLKRDEDSWGRLAGGGSAGRAVARAPRAAGAAGGASGGGGGGGRINWRNVLAQLPKQFKASNVRQIRGLKDKRPRKSLPRLRAGSKLAWSSARLADFTKNPSAQAHHRLSISRRRGSCGAMCYRTTFRRATNLPTAHHTRKYILVLRVEIRVSMRGQDAPKSGAP